MEYIDSLRLFRSVVELKSFSRAAERHGLTRPVVSRAVASLEERIGCRLLNRTTRKISLTAAAERFYGGCVRILDDLEALEADAAGQTREASGVLRLVAHTTSTMTRLVPLIAGFKRAYPKVALEATLTERPVDLVADGYDLGIVVSYMLTSEMTIIRLLERIPYVIAAAPGYLDNAAPLQHPNDLKRHRFVTISPSLRRPTLDFRLGAEILSIPLSFDINSNSPAFNCEMVLQGFGIGIIPITLVERELANGKLVRLLVEWDLVPDSIDIFLAYSNRAHLPAKVRAFLDYAEEFYHSLATSPVSYLPK